MINIYSLNGLLLGLGYYDLLALGLGLHAVVYLILLALTPLAALEDHLLELLWVLRD